MLEVIPVWEVTFSVPGWSQMLRVPDDALDVFVSCLRFSGATRIDIKRETLGASEEE